MKWREALLSLSSVALVCLLALCVALPVSAHTHQAASESAYRHIIVDTDMGLDDVRAILALLADSTITIEAFVTVEGSASLGKGTDNLIGLLEATQSHSIKVLVGNERAELESPPWRQTANGLGGATFPPPRGTTATAATPAVMAELVERGYETEYLALGPLGNLHMLGKNDPGSLRLIHTIWVPAVVQDGLISDWNLLYDAQASKSVFDSANRVVIIDVSGCRGADTVSSLSSLEGNSLSVQWINSLLSRIGSHSGHVMLCDEFAAVGFSRPDLLTFDEETYSVRTSEEQVFELVPSSHGSVRVARLVDCKGALAILKNLWEHGPSERGWTHTKAAVPPEILLRSFHGHLGPYVVIGYRMGKLALEELHSEGHFGISAEVHSPLQTPRSCLIDGVQIGSGCTLGKRNIRVHESVEPAWAVFESSNGEQVTIRLRPEIPELVQELVSHKGVEAAGQAFLDMRIDRLFDTDRRERSRR